MFGISVYLNKTIGKDERAYMEKAKTSGFTSVFTSLHIPEDDSSQLRKRVETLAGIAREIKLELVVDVSPSSLSLIGSSFEQAECLTSLGITGLRVDYGIAPGEIARLSNKMKIALNASTLTKKEFSEVLQYGANPDNLEAWHNYYPRPETGLGTKYLKEKNNWLRSLGITVMAFVPGDSQKRGPLFQGLPTLEKHRTALPFVSALELMQELYTQKVFIGDPALSDGAFRQFHAYQESCILLKAKPFISLPFYYGVQTNRLDPARDCIRSAEARSFLQKQNATVKPLNTTERKKGSITIDNSNYLRYEGELQIALRDLPADKKVNVVGTVMEEDLPLLSYIGPGQKFLLDWKS